MHWDDQPAERKRTPRNPSSIKPAPPPAFKEAAPAPATAPDPAPAPGPALSTEASEDPLRCSPAPGALYEGL